MGRKRKGEGEPKTINAVMDAVSKAGIEGVELVKGSVSYAWLVFDQVSAKHTTYVPVRKGNRYVGMIAGLTTNEWIDSARDAYNQVHPPQICEGRFMILSGNAFSGYAFFGPFTNEDVARGYAVDRLGQQQFVVVEMNDEGGRVCA